MVVHPERSLDLGELGRDSRINLLMFLFHESCFLGQNSRKISSKDRGAYH